MTTFVGTEKEKVSSFWERKTLMQYENMLCEKLCCKMDGFTCEIESTSFPCNFFHRMHCCIINVYATVHVNFYRWIINHLTLNNTELQLLLFVYAPSLLSLRVSVEKVVVSFKGRMYIWIYHKRFFESWKLTNISSVLMKQFCVGKTAKQHEILKTFLFHINVL